LEQAGSGSDTGTSPMSDRRYRISGLQWRTYKRSGPLYYAIADIVSAYRYQRLQRGQGLLHGYVCDAISLDLMAL